MGPTASPRADRSVRVAGGRRVAYSEWGDPAGTVVVLLHGRPGSRLLCPDAAATESAGVRLVTVDRPGYGRSDPAPPFRVVDWVEDYLAVLDALECESAPVVGWSSGGPYAAACAARAPGRVRKVGLAAASGPWEEVPGAMTALSAEALEQVRLVRVDRTAALERTRERWQRYADDPASILAPSEAGDDPDDRLLRLPEVAEPIRTWFVEGARQGTAGISADWAAEVDAWGFRLSEITTPALVWAGDRDPLVDMHHARYLAAAIPRASLVVYAGEGHLFPLTHWQEMLTSLVAVHGGP